jgi:peptide/nickel transport system permease protein
MRGVRFPHLVSRMIGVLAGLFVVTIVTFTMIRLIPGSVEDVMLGTENVSDETRELFREKYGLNDSFIVQYVDWMKGLLSGDLGTSVRTQQPVKDELSAKLRPSLELAVISVTLSTVIALVLGTIAALRRDSMFDRLTTAGSLIGSSVPDFVVGLILLLVVAKNLESIPTFGYEPMSAGLWEWASHLILPVAALTASLVGILVRLTRSSVLSTLSADHVRTATGNGLSRRTVLMHHVVRPSLVPIITTAALLFVAVIAGVVVVEYLFSIPGMGRLILDAIANRDYPLIQGATLLIGITSVMVSLIVDLVHSALDPRIRT